MGSTARRRRNGLLEACEPCRQRKLACDHALPTCGRCIRRNTTSSCVYNGGGRTQTVRVDKPPNQTALTSSTPPRSQEPVASTDAIVSRASETASTPDPLFGGSSGFLGPTSFSAVFQENRSRLFTPDSGMANASSPNKGGVIDEETVRLGARILEQLPDQTTCTMLIGRFNRTKTTLGDLGLEHCMTSLWATFGQQLLSSDRRASAFENTSRLISQSSLIPLELGEDFKDFLDATTGPRMRWEVIGLLFTLWAFGALSSPDDDNIFAKQEGPRRDRIKFAVEMYKLARSCASLSERSHLVNILRVFLSYHSCILETVINDDSSLTAWRMHQDLIALTTFIGIHRDAGSSVKKVTFASEFQHRLFASIYDLDKQLATFTGRPPGLSWRHISCPLPLDVSDDVITAGGYTLQLATSALDNNGWNTNGKCYAATRIRAYYLLAQIRDEILEIALNPAALDVLSRIKEVKAHSMTLHQQIPTGIIYQHEEAAALLSSDGPTSSASMLSLIRLALDHLQNQFLLERLALKWGQIDTQALIDVSRETLKLAIILWTNRDRFQSTRYNLEGMAMLYGAPASGILCVELLKRHSSSATFPRSETIQDLSIFAAFLGWVRPSAPNAGICRSIKSIIGHVLDRVLNSPAETAGLDVTDPVNDWGIDLSLWDDVGSLDLLDTYDCFRTSSWPETG